MDLVEALSADADLVCLVGAGETMTTLSALATRLDRAVVTATVRIPAVDDHVAEMIVTDDPVGALRSVDRWPVGLVRARLDDGYCRGYDPETVTAVRATPGPTTVLAKADGSRGRPLKAPGDHEPRVPATADTVVPMAGARVVGESLSADHAHRPDRVARITGLDRGDEIAAADVAAVLASRDGGRKRVPPTATVVPLVTVDDDADGTTAAARAIAAAVHDRVDVPRVVLARSTDARVVDVIA